MPLQRRILRVTFDMPSGPVVLDETVDVAVNVHRDCLGLQHTADITILNLTKVLREQLLTQFSTWNKRLAQSGVTKLDAYVNVLVEAGYSDGGTSVVFTGQVVESKLNSVPPNISVLLRCAARQIDKTKDSPYPPQSGTFKEFVQWAGNQLGLQVDCETKHDNEQTPRLLSSVHTLDALLMALQAAFRPYVVAYIDNNRLIVRDLNRALTGEMVVELSEFVGVPQWTDYGATFQVLFDSRLKLGGLVRLNSEMNSGLALSPFLIFGLDYALTSRQEPFYITGTVYPPASD